MTRYLGQHFLINKNKIRKIIDALELKSGDTIIEIGPGHGELTSKLVNWLNSELERKTKSKVILIEKDNLLAENLKKRFIENKKIKVINGDVLKILPDLINQLTNQPINYKLVGNIPYYITGYLLRIIGELKNKPSLIVLTVQKEVAERTAAKPPKMNLLAASVQFWAKPEIVGYIPRKDFSPPPKVDSAIIKLVIKQLSNYEIAQLPNYYKLIKILFKQPRKTILNNLRDEKNANIRVCEASPQGSCREKLLKIGVNPNNRPQNLSMEQIIKLSKLF